MLMITHGSEAVAAWGGDATITKSIKATYMRSKAVIVACGVETLAIPALHTSAIIGGELADVQRTGL
ncbi:hypothetical protein HX792_06920 [Pseudomonas sp. B6002]|nr:hypothetical protein [Pseudomonas sp. B6002]